jgi:hypothetical protein
MGLNLMHMEDSMEVVANDTKVRDDPGDFMCGILGTNGRIEPALEPNRA